MRGEGFQPVDADQINPYTAQPITRGVPLKRGSPESKAALRAAAEHAQRR